jgi:hypothetical protein
MPSTDRKLELKAKTSVAQTGSQPYVYAKGLNSWRKPIFHPTTVQHILLPLFIILLLLHNAYKISQLYKYSVITISYYNISEHLIMYLFGINDEVSL